MCCVEPYGIVISRLNPGDGIIIRADHGYPRVKEDTEDIILAVDGFSALTVEGRILRCLDSIELTKKNYANFKVSDRAKEILEGIKSQNKNSS